MSVKMSEDEAISAVAILTREKYPRELAKREKWFSRNSYAHDSEEVAEFAVGKKDRFVSVYSFEGEAREGEPWDRSKALVDRLFFDFDCSLEDLSAPLAEVSKLVRFVESLGGEPILLFSGSKGFHVHVLLSERIPAEKLKPLGKLVVEGLGLKHADPVVFEVSRLCRVPGSVNSRSGLTAVLLDPSKLPQLSPEDVLRAAKEGGHTLREPAEIDAEDLEARLSRVHRREFPSVAKASAKLPRPFVPAPTNFTHPLTRIKKLKQYAESLKVHGHLMADPEIAATHASEHMARVYLVLMMIEDGWSDEEIHAVFRRAKDYDAKKTQYYIDYNRKWLAKRCAPSVVPQIPSGGV